MKNLKTTLRTTLAAGLAAAAIATAAPAANAHTTTGTFRGYTASSGISSQYHVYADGVDWSKPVGVVFYFDGDYWTTNQSKIYNPSDGALTGMAREANARNMIFVPVISPDKNAGGDGITWWEDQDRNGTWFREYANWFINATGVDRNNVWTIGYSGGAEFETFELGADHQTSWRNNGGSVMVGGGGTSGMQTAPSAAAKAMSFQWWEGSNDVAGNTNPPTWSASAAGRQGYDAYGAAGYWNRGFNTVWGATHYQYNFPSILAQSLDRAGVKKDSGPTLKGAIGEKYNADGGATTYGSPTTNEFGLIDGGVGQQFAKNYTIYWRSGNGAHPVWFNGAIGNLYRANNYEHTFGFPTNDETVGPNGGAYQYFRQASGREDTLYWTQATGAHTLFENGAIGRAFTDHSRSYGWGYPAIEEQGFDAGGAKQVFFQPGTGQRTAVYWSPSTGARGMVERGAIYNKWVENGHVNGPGYPVTDEFDVDGGAATYYRDAQGKETGIYWSPESGAHMLNSKGALYWYWIRNGYTSGMGFPTSDEHVGADGKTHLTFSKGVHLTWTASEGVKVAQ